MGNCGEKLKKETKGAERKRVMEAQDRMVQAVVDTPDGERIDAETDSIGPDWDPNEVFPLLPVDDEEKRKGLQKMKQVVSQHYDEIDSKTLNVDIREYEFPFENLVFEGGGNKGLAYCGAVRVLEEIGVWPNIKRFAGSSAGAMTAALLAVGYNSFEIEQFLSQDLSKIFLDHSCGYFSLLPNLIKAYGWNPGKRIFHWFGNAMETRTGSADITFNEIYERYGKELCVVVTNLNMMNAEYFHPKTTPDVPVRVAVRMSMAIPGLFQASAYEQHGQLNTYVDGGVLCNYPISCYDGWWLSMKMKDSFLNRLQPLEDFPKLFEKKERFGTYNDRTLGFLLYADNERDILRDILQQRVGAELPPFPDTKLAKEKIKKKKLQEKVKYEHLRILHAVSAFLKVLRKHNADNDDKISKSELRNALNDVDEFPKRYVERLFGKNVTVDEAMAALDEDGNGEVYYHEIVHFIERTGVSLQARFLGYQRKEIKGVFSFFDTLQSALLTNVKRVFVEERDIDRTVGINTGHVGTSDFRLDPADREFVVEQGRRSTESYLRYYVVQNNPPKKPLTSPSTLAPPSFFTKAVNVNNAATANANVNPVKATVTETVTAELVSQTNGTGASNVSVNADNVTSPPELGNNNVVKMADNTLQANVEDDKPRKLSFQKHEAIDMQDMTVEVHSSET